MSVSYKIVTRKTSKDDKEFWKDQGILDADTRLTKPLIDGLETTRAFGSIMAAVDAEVESGMPAVVAGIQAQPWPDGIKSEILAIIENCLAPGCLARCVNSQRQRDAIFNMAKLPPTPAGEGSTSVVGSVEM